MNKVFVFERTELDISDLKRFGDVRYLFDGEDSRRPLRDEELENQIFRKLDLMDYDPDNDYLAVVGKILAVTIFLSAASCVYGPVKTLAFDPRRSSYYVRRMGHEDRT